MIRLLILYSILCTATWACHSDNHHKSQTEDPAPEIIDVVVHVDQEPSLIDLSGNTIESRFLVPESYRRVDVDTSSFGAYLRNLPLKPDGAEVTYYDGRKKPDRNIYHAVVDLPIGNKDLHQCADAVMRLRAEYLYEQEAYDQIHFNYTNGFKVDYAKWMEGYRIAVNGNQTSWVKRYEPSNTPDDFWNYLENIFMYAGTLSLAREMTPIGIQNMAIGDVFIQGGSPGHAVIVVDMAEQKETGEKCFILAQSYMPAQEIQILRSYDSPAISPWVSMGFNEYLDSPEWIFQWTDLKRFED